MKYFAKYLPVEGDIFKLPIGSPIWYNNAYRTLKEDKVLEHVTDLPVKTRWEFYKLRNAQPAKLFLCSRDIQVGDKVIAFIDPHYIEVGEIKKEIGDEWLVRQGLLAKSACLKVIGEISPQAIWVKEGDEFDEENTRIYAYDNIQNAPSKLKDIPYFIQKDIWFSIKIKGQCGHYH